MAAAKVSGTDTINAVKTVRVEKMVLIT